MRKPKSKKLTVIGERLGKPFTRNKNNRNYYVLIFLLKQTTKLRNHINWTNI